MKISIYLSTFRNLSVFYISGQHNFLSDFLSKSFLDAAFKSSAEGPSKLFAEIDTVYRKFLHKKIKPEELPDVLLADKKTEYVDIFSKQYHYLSSDKNLQKIAKRKVPSEIGFLGTYG